MHSNQLNISHKKIHTKSLEIILKENKEKLIKSKKQLLFFGALLIIFSIIILSFLDHDLITGFIHSVLILFTILKTKTIYTLAVINKKIEYKLNNLTKKRTKH